MFGRPRSEAYLTRLADELAKETEGDAIAIPTDVTNPAGVEAGFDRVREAFGPVEVLCNNAYPTGDIESGLAASDGGPLGADRSAFERSWRVWVYGSFLCSEQAVADTVAENGGTVLLSSVPFALRGGETSHNPAGFAARGLARSLAHRLWPEGVHVVNVIIDGNVGKLGQRDRADLPDDEWIHPDRVADTYWYLVEQHSSAWTLELDLGAHAAPIGFG